LNPSLLPKITAMDWGRKHAGHRKIQSEGIGENNEKEIIFFMSICKDCQEVYIYDWVLKMDGIDA
jgi:hypothetical protein